MPRRQRQPRQSVVFVVIVIVIDICIGIAIFIVRIIVCCIVITIVILIVISIVKGGPDRVAQSKLPSLVLADWLLPASWGFLRLVMSECVGRE